jgi:hemerythrin-like domain-containing protein
VADEPVLTDTSDMVAIHDTFRRAFGDAPGQVASVSDGDQERARQVADYLGEVCWLLHVHHEGEDQLLYPLLKERAPEHMELFVQMESQHAAVATSLERASGAIERFGASGSAVDGKEAADACQAVLAATADHLIKEEQDVLPIAGRVISPPEWGALPAHALSAYHGDRIWLPFGLAYESMSSAMQESLLSHLPPPVLDMWTGGGADAFAAEMAVIRGA